jgi:hypothetical protein
MTALALPARRSRIGPLHDAAGHVTGFARTDSNAVTRFYDSALPPRARREPTAMA